MIDITKLYCESITAADGLRYGEDSKTVSNAFEKQFAASARKPIVVWNLTRNCNLNCLHCYSNCKPYKPDQELKTDECFTLIDDLSQLGIPALLFSGGEPLLRKDFFEIVSYASAKKIRYVLSTNGTLIDENMAEKIKNSGFSYVGISLDGIGPINDQFRGSQGAFVKTMKAFRHLRSLNQKVGLRMTLTKYNIQDLENIFDFIEKENINRACFYHLVYVGKGNSEFDISHEESRKAMDIILKRTKDFCNRGLDINILTVDNHVDGAYLYLKLLQEDKAKAERTHQKLLWNGGGTYSSGVGIGAIDPEGYVHPDQFWQHYSLGNVKKTPFSKIWYDTSDQILNGLKNRKVLLKGKCSRCKWIDICGGALRVRADIYFNDPWMEDPACYLTESEITDA